MDKPDAVYFFATCLVDLMYPRVGLAGMQLISREGVEVIFPQDQTCCGQPAPSTPVIGKRRAGWPANSCGCLAATYR